MVVQGCAGGVSSQDAAGYDGHLAAGDYPGAAAFAIGAGQVAPDGRSANLLWSLNAGAAMVYSGDGARTVPVLDHAEEMMKLRDVGTTGEMGQYRAKTYDGVMVNTYKAMAALQAGDRNTARTELLRAEDRQARAEREFEAEAAADRARRGQGAGVDLQGALRNVQSDATFRQASAEISNSGGYAPFINPFATYLAGLYFLNTEDSNRDRARAAFLSVSRIVGRNPQLSADIVLAQGSGRFSPKTWVIFENGQGSTIEQYSITFPVPIVGRRSGVSVATVALPRLRENAPAARALLVGDRQQPTTVVGNFDYVMRSEFQRRYPAIMAMAVAEAALKIAVQNVAAQEKSGLALLAATVVSQVSTADTRSWTALPKDFQVARIETPKDGIVRLRMEGYMELQSAKVPTDVSSIVYVKAFRAGSPPAVHVLRF
ncbi:MAG: hypothetical protein H7Z10_05240 [Gemmatimonadaceae bacterium]|nr:hypothetical protein [Acetobacteraceae bacterium]